MTIILLLGLFFQQIKINPQLNEPFRRKLFIYIRICCYIIVWLGMEPHKMSATPSAMHVAYCIMCYLARLQSSKCGLRCQQCFCYMLRLGSYAKLQYDTMSLFWVGLDQCRTKERMCYNIHPYKRKNRWIIMNQSIGWSHIKQIYGYMLNIFGLTSSKGLILLCEHVLQSCQSDPSQFLGLVHSVDRLLTYVALEFDCCTINFGHRIS